MDRKVDYNLSAIIKLLNIVNTKLSELKVTAKLDDVDIKEINLDTTEINNKLDTIVATEILRRGLISDIKDLLSGNLSKLNNLEDIYIKLNDLFESINSIKDDVAINKITLEVIKNLLTEIKDILQFEEEEKPYHVGSYTIDQRNPLALGEDVINVEIPAKDATEKVEIDGRLQYVDTIRRIREESQIYVGLYNETTEELEIKLVSREDKRCYADGTPVVITKTDKLDMFMKLPEFWWKCIEESEDVYTVKFTMFSEYADNTWNHWDGHTFISVHEAKRLYYRDDQKYYVVGKPGVQLTDQSGGFINAKADSRNRGHNTEYTLIMYETVVVMTLLAYGWFGTTDCKTNVGSGPYNDVDEGYTGKCDIRGFVDTDVAIDGDNIPTNFWGLENWCGNLIELYDNLEYSQGTVTVLDRNNNVVRTITGDAILSSGSITKIILGEFGDILPKQLKASNDYSIGFASRKIGLNNYIFRGDNNMSRLNAVGFISLRGLQTLDSPLSSRLQYTGAFRVVDNFTE